MNLGEYIIYQNGDRYEIGKIKRITHDGAFVWHHDGETASKTLFDRMHKIVMSMLSVRRGSAE